jgi:hypothetical protein
MKNVWLLTYEAKAYDQFGRYYEQLYAQKPTIQQLIESGVPEKECDYLLEHGDSTSLDNYIIHYLEEIKLL